MELNKLKKNVILLSIIVVITLIFLLNLEFEINEDKQDIVEIPITDSLFTIYAPQSKISFDLNSKIAQYEEAEFELKIEFSDIYQELGFVNQKSNAVVIYPTFTESAYSENGFYDYYNSKCDESCLTVPIQDDFRGEYASSRAAHRVLQLLGYDQLTDIDIDKNPEILTKYDKVILLHNEYVTKSIFSAITSHPKVVYLYPNALYAEIKVDYKTGTISLVKGHGFPEKQIDNGFDWIYDNTHPYEFDNHCTSWEFDEIPNGFMLNCYPEYIIFKDQKLLETIKNL